MRLAAYLLALVLAATFVVSATAKWRDLPGTARAFRALGVPAPYASARGVGAVELAVAAALVVAPGLGAAAALVALGAFSVVLVSALWRGVQAPCACFGGRSGRPVSARDLARNAVLAALAVAIVLAWGVAPAWG